MAMIWLLWSHKMEVRVSDPDVPASQYEHEVRAALAHGQHYMLSSRTKTVIVPHDLLRTAIVEITE